MGNVDYQNIAYDNVATSFSATPDNGALSDELLAPASYSQDGDTLYAKSHRVGRRVYTAVISLSIVTVGGALLFPGLSEALVPTQAETMEEESLSPAEELVLSQGQFLRNGDKLSATFDLVNPTKRDFYLDILYGGEVQKTVPFLGEGHFEEEIALPSPLGETTAISIRLYYLLNSEMHSFYEQTLN